MADSLTDRLSNEADQCRNDGADDIAALLDEARAKLTAIGRDPLAMCAGALRDEMVVAIYQYRDDLRRPPAPDSVERRLAWIEGIIAHLSRSSRDGEEIRLLANVTDWLTSALDCKDWSWDADQREAATMDRDAALSLLSKGRTVGGTRPATGADT